MPLNLQLETADALMAELRREVRQGNTLQETAQRLMSRVLMELKESIVLARTYATIPYGMLPSADRDFVQSVARTRNAGQSLAQETRVLSLLGTAGVEPAWCDRYRSRNHLGIPLISEEFVAGIPMIAGLIRQLGSSVSWYEKIAARELGGEQFGVFTDSFFVQNPAEARDLAGRLLIPAQDFVRAYNVNTVLGVGGEFLAARIILVCILFSSEELEQTPPWLLRLPLMLAMASQSLVAEGRIYADSAEPPG